eukprot:COSAG05_NODE_4_length_49189_cov_157.128784_15_plen_167_part_00
MLVMPPDLAAVSARTLRESCLPGRCGPRAAPIIETRGCSCLRERTHAALVLDLNETCAMFTETELHRIADDESFQFLGNKARVLGPAGRKLLLKQLHCRFGHQGHHPDCHICNTVKKSTRRIARDPKRCASCICTVPAAAVPATGTLPASTKHLPVHVHMYRYICT